MYIIGIVQNPKSATVSIGEVATFTCSAIANFIHWYINGGPLHTDSDGYVNISETKMMNIRQSTLYIRGLMTNNGSNLFCVAAIGNNHNMSNKATLYVQGIIIII